jgi:hypothetical protein
LAGPAYQGRDGFHAEAVDGMTVGDEDVRAAQMLTGATFAMFLLVSVVPVLRPYATRIRLAIVVIYFVAAAGFMTYLLVR